MAESTVPLDKLLLGIAGDVSPFAADPALPFRPLVQQLTWQDAQREAAELVQHYLLFNQVPAGVACCVSSAFVAHVPDTIVPRSFTAAQALHKLDGSAFAKGVVHQLRLFCQQLAVDSQQLETIQKQATYHDISGSTPLAVASASHKNQRRTHEDRHVAIRDLSHVFGKEQASECDALFGVFDGHMGAEVAQYAATHLASEYVRAAAYASDAAAALRQAFGAIDKRVLHKSEQEKVRSGSTAVVSCVRAGWLHTAWLGDSHAVLIDSVRGARTLTTGHSPENPDEYARIEAAGGTCIVVQGEMRVNGVLNLSRAFGDVLCRPCIIAEPDVVSHELTETECVLVLCCDGVWDVVDEDVYLQALTALANSCPTKKDFANKYHMLAEGICNKAKASGSTDNLTCVCVFLKPLNEVWADFHL